ncbi:MAG TPA: EAL domain-containing protein [Roseiflexaceae bacterium]|nr:EAL domain-containing protein [Roseiflexaceae bacterium]
MNGMRVSLNLIQKFIGFLLLASIIPLLVVGLSSFEVSRTIVREEAARYTAELSYDQKRYLDLQLEQIASLIARLASVEEITGAIASDGAAADTYTNLATQARIGYILDGYADLHGLVSIDIFTLRGGHYHVGDTLNISNIRADARDRIFAAARAASPGVAWIGIEDNVNASSGSRKVIAAARMLATIDPGTLESRETGVLVVNYSADYLHEYFRQVDFGEDAYLTVIDAHRRVIYHPDKRLYGAELSAALAGRLDARRGTFVQAVDGQPMLVTYARSDISEWTVLSFVPLRTLEARAAPIGAAMIIALSAAFALVLAATWLVTCHVVAPLRQLTRRFQLYQAGEPGWQAPLAVRSRDEIGELSRWFNTFQESLAAKHAAEEALRESEERYALALQGAKDGIWDWDLRSGAVHYSARWKALLGYTDADIGHSPEGWLGRIHPDDIERVRAQIATHLEGRAPHFESEHRILRGDGRTYSWVLARGLAIYDEQGRPVRMAGSFTDINARKAIEERLRHEALHDPLTDLPNRAYLMDHLEWTIARARRRPEIAAAVLFMDLDRFKIINDSLGHAAGDQLLTTAARRLSAARRAGDFVARLGGDEFAVVLHDLHGVDDAAQVAARVQAHLAEPLDLAGVQVSIQASIGITMVSAAYERAEDLLRDADTALYQAKANGRACYAIFDAAMHARTLGLLRLEADLRQAIVHQELDVHYQPIAHLGNGRIRSFEALVRWRHPERGPVSPAVFVPLAEETGLIGAIDRWVLRQACAQARVWIASGHADIIVSVNISARNLHDPQLPHLIQQVLAETGLAPRSLQLEITESTAMTSVEQTIHSLGQLAAMGVETAIDDFGTSYSSLSYLRRLPARTLKIDRSFIHDITENHDAAAITSAIIAMGHILGLHVVAEGVETDGQRAFLLSHGCDAVQGYLLSHALTAEAATQLLHQHAAPAGAGEVVAG